MILFLDDDPDDLQLISEMAGIVGFTDPIKTFFRSEEAFAFIEQEVTNIKLIVTDINMPVMNGFVLRKKLMELGDMFVSIPFILISTSHSEVEQLLATQLGVFRFYKKPSTFMGMKEILLELKELV